MHIGKIDVNKEILNAQADGKLVIFAGAGVSKPHPSNYPDFKNLANQIADGVLTLDEDEPIERFLGRLKDRPINVHQIAKDLLSRIESKPNLLHRYLVTIATSNNEFRLITTNFDNHFSKVAKKALGGKLETFMAPALPLGNHFQGIVYLHGCVDCNDENNLVLTDQDFARAYLIEGWATRFLLSLFRDYTVLFVGYSHNDTVMQYLARGMSKGYGKGRYALTPARENKNDHWTFLGITPIPYQQEHDDDHSALHETLKKWARYTMYGALDHEKRIKGLLSGTSLIKRLLSDNPLLIPKEDEDYLEAALTDQTKLQFFVNYATDPAWLRWVEKKRALDLLFQPHVQLNECQQLLARWIAVRFACDYSEYCMSLFQRKGQRINPMLWDALIRHLQHGKSNPSNDVLVRWIYLLLQHAYIPEQQTELCFLLAKCDHPDCLNAALMLLDRVTQLKFELEPAIIIPSFKDDKRQVNWNLSTYFEYNRFKKVWEHVLQPQMPVAAEKVASIIIHRLQQAYYMYVNVRDSHWCPISYTRSAIEPHGQDRYPKQLDALVDLARNSLEWIVRNKAEQARRIIDSLICSEVPLLRRLAVHSVTESSFVTPDERIDWLLNNNLLYAFDEKHEVYRLLNVNYPLSSEHLRQRLLNIAAIGPGYVEEDEQGHRSYMIFNLLQWLHKATLDCQHTVKHLEQLQQDHPDFIARDYPDLDYHISFDVGGNDDPRRITAAFILNKDSKKDIDWFISHADNKDIDQISRSNFVYHVEEAVTHNREWGWCLLNSLAKSSAWDSELWDGIFDGLAKNTKATKEWRSIISFLEDNAALLQNVAPGMRILKKAVENLELPFSQQRDEKIFMMLWNKALGAIIPTSHGERSWFFTVKDHVGGTAVDFWVFALYRHLKRHNEKGIPNRYKRIFERMLFGNTPSEDFGCAMLAHYIQYLYSLDDKWTQKNILPLLDWSIDEDRAERAWQCYLNNSSVNLNILEASMDYYRQTFSRVGTKLSIFRNSFVGHIALFAADSFIDLLANNWLADFISSIEAEDREHWVVSIGQHLIALNTDAVIDVWNRWLNTYWKKRVLGIPLRLEQDELDRMLYWLPHLRPVFPAVVRHICSGPPLGNKSHLYDLLPELDWLVEYPKPLANLLCFMLRHAIWPLYASKDDMLKLVKIVYDAGGLKSELGQICNRLCELGCCSLDELQVFLR